MSLTTSAATAATAPILASPTTVAAATTNAATSPAMASASSTYLLSVSHHHHHNVLGPLEACHAALHAMFCSAFGVMPTADNDENGSSVYDCLWRLYSGLEVIRTALVQQCVYYQGLQGQVTRLQVATANNNNNHISDTTTTTSSIALEPPPCIQDVLSLMETLEPLAQQVVTSNAFGLGLLPADVSWHVRCFPTQLAVLRQDVTHQAEASKVVLLRIAALYQQLAAQGQQERPSSLAANTPNDNATRANEQVSQTDLFIQELCRGKIVHASQALTDMNGPCILQALANIPQRQLPSRLNLQHITTKSLLAWRGLALVLSLRDCTKDLTLPPLPPLVLSAIANSFRAGQLERLEIKKTDNDETLSVLYRGQAVQNAFESLGSIVTTSLALFVYQELYDYNDLICGLVQGFAKLPSTSSRPAFLLALSLSSSNGNLTMTDPYHVGNMLLLANVVTDLFVDADEFNDRMYGALGLVMQSTALRKLYLCDAKVPPFHSEALFPAMVTALARSKLDLLVLANITCYEIINNNTTTSSSGKDLVDAVLTALATTACPLRHLVLGFADNNDEYDDACGCPWARHESLARHLPAMKSLESLTVDSYPETARLLTKAAAQHENVKLRWDKKKKKNGQAKSPTGKPALKTVKGKEGAFPGVEVK